ncbi:MAG TPA: lysylphosphatidylglycerol synthase domain-containing protein [Bacteroidia bacterium]|jgi:hypothetical protein|nr:lysylphosphatidylglycerol synthase domain-containing protein [Bacteroidia bacterium]
MKENRKTIILIIKILIGVACFWLIAQRLYNSYSSENVQSLKEIFSSGNLLILASLLLLLNWGIEIKKWSVITKPIEKISFGKAWQSVWTGVCIGNLTPGRVGEFAGRILFFSPDVRAKVATSHFVCGITQLIVTIVAGCAGLVFYSSGLNMGTYIVTLSLEIILLLFLIIILLRINKVITWLLNLSKLKKFNFEGLSYSRGMLLKLIGLSVIRYFVFSAQFYLLLVACGVHGGFPELAAAISIMYLVLSTIPMISFIEIAVRAYVVVILFGSFNQNDWQLTAASTLLWFINIAVPSVIGYIFILKNNFTFSINKNGVV